MKSIALATSSIVLALACSSANAEVRIDATWNADVYSLTDPSAPPIPLSGEVTFHEPYVPFPGSYTFLAGAYEVSLFADFAHGSGVEGTVSVVGPEGSGPGLWVGNVTLVPELMNTELMLAGLALLGAVAGRRKALKDVLGEATRPAEPCARCVTSGGTDARRRGSP